MDTSRSAIIETKPLLAVPARWQILRSLGLLQDDTVGSMSKWETIHFHGPSIVIYGTRDTTKSRIRSNRFAASFGSVPNLRYGLVLPAGAV